MDTQFRLPPEQVSGDSQYEYISCEQAAATGGGRLRWATYRHAGTSRCGYAKAACAACFKFRVQGSDVDRRHQV
jgi:hypothetical protein